MRKLIFIISILIITGITFSCSKSEDSNPDPNPAGSTPGPKFLAVKSIITSSCAMSGCHISPSNSGGVNFESDANIVSNGSRIKTQAVDQGTMPTSGPLSASEKAIITEWINAGGKLTD
jgi:uncharacterized membrane protein